jgi:hypothetical protein
LALAGSKTKAEAAAALIAVAWLLIWVIAAHKSMYLAIPKNTFVTEVGTFEYIPVTRPDDVHGRQLAVEHSRVSRIYDFSGLFSLAIGEKSTSVAKWLGNAFFLLRLDPLVDLFPVWEPEVTAWNCVRIIRSGIPSNILGDSNAMVSYADDPFFIRRIFPRKINHNSSAFAFHVGIGGLFSRISSFLVCAVHQGRESSVNEQNKSAEHFNSKFYRLASLCLLALGLLLFGWGWWNTDHGEIPIWRVLLLMAIGGCMVSISILVFGLHCCQNS